LRVEGRVVDSPARFEYREEAKSPVIASAVETSTPMILKNATKKKWSAQLVKVSVKDLCREDQHDLMTALSKTDKVRARLTNLLNRVKLLPQGALRRLLSGQVELWRNKVKHGLEYFIQRFLYPLKELGKEGCHYLVFLEDFPDSSVVPRSFTVRSEGPGFGNVNNVRANLLRVVEAVDDDIDVSSRVIMTAEDQCMNFPERRKRFK